MADSSINDLLCGYFDLVNSRPAYERAAAMYEGTIKEVYSSTKVMRLLAKFGLNSMDSFNFAHIPVDALANKLRLNAVTADKQDNSEGIVEKNDEVNEVIEDLFEFNELAEELPNLFRNTGKLGDYYMMVWPVVGKEEDESGVSKGYDIHESAQALVTGDPMVQDNEIEIPEGKKKIVAVDMMMLDPFTTRVMYHPENPKKKQFAIRSWEEGEKENRIVRVNLYYADRIERWFYKGKPSQRKDSAAKWQPYTLDGEKPVLNNPFEEVPIYHFRTDRSYGTPDHINAYGPQLAINKLVTSHLASVDYQSFPQRYALTDPTADLSGQQGTDSDPFAPEDGEDHFPEDDDNESQLEADAGSVWELHGMKAVGQFEAANPDSYLKPFDRYVKALAQATGTPFHYFDRQGERPPSGENIRQVNEFLIAKASARQTSLGSELRKAVTFALTMLGHDVERVNVVWEPLENVTSYVEWQAIELKIACGVPTEVALIEAGYRAEQVTEWKKQREEQEAAEKAEAHDAEMEKIDASAKAKLETTQANAQSKSASAAKPTTPAKKPTSSPS